MSGEWRNDLVIIGQTPQVSFICPTCVGLKEQIKEVSEEGYRPGRHRPLRGSFHYVVDKSCVFD